MFGWRVAQNPAAQEFMTKAVDEVKCLKRVSSIQTQDPALISPPVSTDAASVAEAAVSVVVAAASGASVIVVVVSRVAPSIFAVLAGVLKPEGDPFDLFLQPLFRVVKLAIYEMGFQHSSLTHPWSAQ